MILVCGVAIFGLIILIHELGHFLVGRAFGIRFLSFSIGMGPRIFIGRWLDTPFYLSVLPLGGYVRPLAVLDDDSEDLAANGPLQRVHRFLFPLSDEEVRTLEHFDSASRENSFNKGYFANAAMILGGCAFNLASVFLVYFVVFMSQSKRLYENSMTVGEVQPSSFAEHAGMRAGDKIVTVNGQIAYRWEPILKKMQQHDGRHVILHVLRRSGASTDTVVLKLPQFEFYYHDDAPALAFKEMGFAPPFKSSRSGVVEAAMDSVHLMWTGAWAVWNSLFGVDEPATPRSQAIYEQPARIVGIVESVFVMGLFASQSIQSFVIHFGAGSLVVIFLNLLPLPLLDGGQLVLLTIERFAGREVSMGIRSAIQQVGTAALLVLTLALFGLDVVQAWL